MLSRLQSMSRRWVSTASLVIATSGVGAAIAWHAGNEMNRFAREQQASLIRNAFSHAAITAVRSGLSLQRSEVGPAPPPDSAGGSVGDTRSSDRAPSGEH